MYDDLELYGMKYNTALTVFFVTYVIFEIPSNVVCLAHLSAGGDGDGRRRVDPGKVGQQDRPGAFTTTSQRGKMY